MRSSLCQDARASNHPSQGGSTATSAAPAALPVGHSRIDHDDSLPLHTRINNPAG